MESNKISSDINQKKINISKKNTNCKKQKKKLSKIKNIHIIKLIIVF